jgi:hypothetical protein
VNFRQFRQDSFNRGNGLGRDRRRPQFPSVQDFCTMLREHGLFSFRRAKKQMNPQELQSFVQGQEGENNLFQTAWDGGDEYMQVLANYIISDRNDITPKPTTVQIAANRIAASWDKELVEFAERVESHDWFADFADQASVGRRARERYLELEKIATEKGGFYQLILSLKAQEIGDTIRNGPKKETEQ